MVNFMGTGIVRCRRCRTYINAYVMFTDGGRRWRCNVCVLLNEGNFLQSFVETVDLLFLMRVGLL